MAVAARLILPAASVRGGGPGGSSLNFEDELRRAVSEATSVALEEDLLELVACTACEVLDDLKGDDTSGREALRNALGSILTQGGCDEQQQNSIVAALAEVGGLSNAVELPLRQLAVPEAVARAIPSCSQTRWANRAQVEQERAEEYLEERAAQIAQEEHERKVEEAALLEFYESKKGRKGNEESSADQADAAQTHDSDSDDSGSEDEVARSHRESLQRRLRELGEPITLFGETSAAREARLKHCELCRDQDILASGSTNVMQILDRRAAKGVLAERDDDLTAKRFKPASQAGAINPNMKMLAASAAADDAPISNIIDDEDDDDEQEETEMKVVTTWLRKTLREWEASLTERSKTENNQAAFKAEKNQFRQSKQYLKPLRKALREGDVQRDIIRSITQIAAACDKKEYKFAKEAYMRLAIGNQAWPMGVTFVTFHDRPNRHMIGEEAAAHVLDDETTRKYVQMIKRLITFCEARWPIDPSLAA